MTGLDIHAVMAALAERRPIFHSEADFQFALAWRIAKMADCEVRLEKPFSLGTDGKRKYLDLWLPSSLTAIELKYCTRKLCVERDDEPFALKDQSAHDLRRYDFIADIVRIESLVLQGDASSPGFAIFLTNDHLYWTRGRSGTVDEEFRLHDGQRLSGTMAWQSNVGKGTTKSREEALTLRKSYDLRWECFSTECGDFRYLAVEVR